jgi:hypothetical protein
MKHLLIPVGTKDSFSERKEGGGAKPTRMDPKVKETIFLALVKKGLRAIMTQ